MTLIDRLTGESVAFGPGLCAEEIIEQRLAEADHPRADFRARALHFDLFDESGDRIDPARPVAVSETVTLASPEAVDIIERRDRWLEAIEARGTATTSVSTSTHLALVERTGSRLDDVHRLRAHLEAKRVAAPPASPRSFGGGRIALLAGLGLVLVMAAAGAWWLTGAEPSAIDNAADGAEPRAAEDVLSLPVELEMELVRGASNRTAFEGSEGQNITIFMLAPTGNFGGIDSELELLDGEGNQIGYNDDRQDVVNQVPAGFNGLNSRIDITLPADGVYTVVSGDLSDTNGGSYRLVIEEGGEGGDGFNGFGPGGGPVFEEEAIAIEENIFAGGVRPPAVPSSEVGCDRLEVREVTLPFEDSMSVACEIVVLSFEFEEAGTLSAIVGSPDGDPIIWLLTEDGVPIADTGDFRALDSRLDIEMAPGRYHLEVGNLQGIDAQVDVLIERR